jgi:hypothetical protein
MPWFDTLLGSHIYLEITYLATRIAAGFESGPRAINATAITADA